MFTRDYVTDVVAELQALGLAVPMPLVLARETSRQLSSAVKAARVAQPPDLVERWAEVSQDPVQVPGFVEEVARWQAVHASYEDAHQLVAQLHESQRGAVLSEWAPKVLESLRAALKETLEDLARVDGALAAAGVSSADDAVRAPAAGRKAWAELPDVYDRLQLLRKARQTLSAAGHTARGLPHRDWQRLTEYVSAVPEGAAWGDLAVMADEGALAALARVPGVVVDFPTPAEAKANAAAWEAARKSPSVLHIDGRTQAGIDTWSSISESQRA